MLKYTGHPLVDVGLATITAFVRKDRPEQLTEADLDAIADYMAQNYTLNPLRSYLTVAFPNSGFTQPAFFKQPDKQETYKRRVLRAYRNDVAKTDEQCVFLEFPAADISLNVPNPKKPDLPPGRTFKQHVPLLTGEGVINFYPYGEAGLPVSGQALLAIQALPLGSAKCAGRLLFVHSDNPDVIHHFARNFLDENIRMIGLEQASGGTKMPETHLKYRTLLIQTLLKARQMQLDSLQYDEPFSITAYHMTNLGPNEKLDIYYLPSQVILYLKEVLQPDCEKAWNRIVQRAWEITKAKRGESEAPSPSRNYLYEDLFLVAEDVTRYGPHFIRTYFLRDALRYAKNTVDPRSGYSLQRESDIVSWKLTKPFLRRIMHMEPERIDNIRELGDALADYVKGQNDKRFFRNFYITQRYDYLRNALIKANTEHVRRGNPPFLTFDGYIGVFEEGEELARLDWKLARDLVLIRMVEQLYAAGWLGANQDALAERTQEETESE